MFEKEDIYKNYRKLKKILEALSLILAFFLATILSNLLYKNEGEIFSLNSLVFIATGLLVNVTLNILITIYIKYLATRNINKNESIK